MSRYELREKVIHGTPAFPLEIYSGHADEQNLVLSPLHFHKEFEFCVAVAGRIVVQINENYIELTEGEGVFINSETLHAIMAADNAEGSFTALLFDAGMVASENDIIYSKFISPLMHGDISVSGTLSPDMVGLVTETANIYNRKGYGFELEVKYNITKLLSLLIKTAQIETNEIANKKREIIKQTIDYIHKNYTNPVTLSELAAHVFVSPEYLCRIFSQMSDAPPFEYLNRYRIMQSAKLLLRDNTPVSEISSACGFNSSSYFNKLFMRFVGCTPTAYRKNHKN